MAYLSTKVIQRIREVLYFTGPILVISNSNWTEWSTVHNWTEWSAIWSEIIRVISKSNERAAWVWFEITLLRANLLRANQISRITSDFKMDAIKWVISLWYLMILKLFADYSFYYIHFEITGYPWNLIGSQQGDFKSNSPCVLVLFEITRMISDQIALHSVQLPL